MKIHTAKFIKGITGTDELLYDGKFQVALMGRSNVGKSTLINSLTGKNNLAHTSSHPGRTIRMDFFLINNSFYFVDFPGYGYAKHSSEIREKLAKMMLWYLMYSEVKVRLVILIIDAKVGITAFDADMLKTLNEYHIDHVIVASKADHLKTNQKEKLLASISDTYKNTHVVFHSIKQKYSRDDVLKKISPYLLSDGK